MQQEVNRQNNRVFHALPEYIVTFSKRLLFNDKKRKKNYLKRQLQNTLPDNLLIGASSFHLIYFFPQHDVEFNGLSEYFNSFGKILFPAFAFQEYGSVIGHSYNHQLSIIDIRFTSSLTLVSNSIELTTCQ